MDTSSLVFTLDDGRRWELLATKQSDMRALVFKAVQGDADLITAMDLSRLPEERTAPVPSTLTDGVPWCISGITEVWTSLSETVPLLQGCAFWGPPAPGDYAQRPLLLGVYVAGDDLEFATAERWWSLLQGNPFYVGHSLYHFYVDPP